MSDTELRQSATRLLDDGMGAIDRPLWVAKAVMGLATAWLAEHPADDAEPITEEWLLEVGFQRGWEGPWILGAAGTLAWIDDPNHQVWMLNNQAVKKTQWQTRGDMRRLCAALGITLKETAK